MQPKPDIICAVTDGHGIYAPRVFVSGWNEYLEGATPNDIQLVLNGPDGEEYWDAWIYVEEHCAVIDPATGTRYRIYQDGDIFLIPDGMEWDDSEMWFAWPNETGEQE